MPVKEFCLVPRSQLETKQTPHRTKSQVETKLSSFHRKSPQNALGEALIPEVDTTFDDTAKILVNNADRQYADGILSFLRKHPLIRWDSSGNMMSPITGVNIFDIIRFWVTRNSSFDSEKIEDLKMLVKLTGLPKSYIKNPKAKKVLFKGGNSPLKVKQNIKWDPY